MSPDDFELLLHRDFERTLSPEDEELLCELLRADPNAADRFVEWSELESTLAESLKEQTELPSGVHAIIQKTRRAAWRFQRPESRVPWPSIAVAGLIALTVWLFVLRGGQAAPQPLAGGAIPLPGWREAEETLRISPVAKAEDRSAEGRPRGCEQEDRRSRKAPENAGGDEPPDLRRDALRPIADPDLQKKNAATVPPGKEGDSDPEKSPQQSEARQPRATLERVDGDVARIGDPEPSRPAAGEELLASQGLEIRGAKSGVTLRLDDGTRLELQGDSRLERIQVSGEQRTVKLTRGFLRATVARQAARNSIVFQTPHAEVTVLGTRLVVQALPDLTRVEVEEGRVRSRRLPDGAAIEIPAGFFAQFGKGLSLALKPVLVVRSFQQGVLPTPDYAGTRDTSISPKSPGSSGALDQLHVWSGTFEAPWVALIRWDLTSIPAKSKIVSAEVSFWITGTMGPPAARMLEIRRPWEELEATWRIAGSGRSWQAAGAQGDADRGSKVLGLLAPASRGTSSFPLNEAGVALVQQWVQAPLSNNGIAVSRDQADGAWDLASREWPTAEHRPKLTVTYIPGVK